MNIVVAETARCLTTSNERIDAETETFVVNALDRQAGGADDNSAQANHLVASITLASDPISAEDLAQPSTKRNGDPGCISYEQGVRRLTPVECERLQGFPDAWTALDGTASDSRRYAAMGDAVTVNVARWIGQRLATHGGTA